MVREYTLYDFDLYKVMGAYIAALRIFQVCMKIMYILLLLRWSFKSNLLTVLCLLYPYYFLLVCSIITEIGVLKSTIIIVNFLFVVLILLCILGLCYSMFILAICMWHDDHFIIMKCLTLSLVNFLLTSIVSDINIVFLTLLCLLFALYIFFLSTYCLFRSKLCLW